MTISEIKQIISSNQSDIAFVIGNGINRYPNNPNALSWDDLLIQLWDKVSLQTLTKRPNGISLTEFYDILELENTRETNLQKEVTKLMSDWTPLSHHQLIIDKIRAIDAPVLTTNFEETFAKTFDYQQRRIVGSKFTDFYPGPSITVPNNSTIRRQDSGFGILME